MNSVDHVLVNAYLLSSGSTYRAAGIHQYIYNTFRHLSETSKYALTALVSNGEMPLEWTGNVIRRSPDGQSPLRRILTEQLADLPFLQSLNPTLYHGMGFVSPLLWKGTSVITIYDMSFIRFPATHSAARRIYLRWMTKAAARKASRILTISEHAKSEIVNLLGVHEDKIDVALPGVSLDFERPSDIEIKEFKRRENLPERYLLYLGTIESRKNLQTLLRAYAILPERPAVKLVLAGGAGWGIQEVDHLIQSLALDKDVLKTGYFDRSKQAYLYSGAEAFVFPSLYEGFGMPVLEAMACQTAVIASDSTSLPEIVGSEGILVPATDVNAWREAMTLLLRDSSRRTSLALQGKQRSLQFRWQETAHQTLASYAKALSHGS
jgi:glycosyltransferase involved in cell wall biosynthesis